jgi:hypothetical protein
MRIILDPHAEHFQNIVEGFHQAGAVHWDTE